MEPPLLFPQSFKCALIQTDCVTRTVEGWVGGKWVEAKDQIIQGERIHVHQLPYFMLKLANVKEKHGLWFLLLLYWPLRERQQKLLLLTCLIIVLPILGCFSSGSSLLSVKHFHSHGAWSDARSCWSRWLVRHTCGSDGVVGFGSCRVSLQVYLLPAERALAGCLYSLAQPKLLHFGSAFAGAEGDVLGDVFRKLIAKTIVPFG